jgi:hypothetical protein
LSPALRSPDVDFEWRLTICAAPTTRPNRADTKREAGERTVPLYESVRKALHREFKPRARRRHAGRDSLA